MVLVSKPRKMVRVQTRDAVIFQSKTFKDKDVLITGNLHGFTSPGLPWAP